MILKEFLSEVNINSVTIPEYCYYFDQTKFESA